MESVILENSKIKKDYIKSNFACAVQNAIQGTFNMCGIMLTLK